MYENIVFDLDMTLCYPNMNFDLIFKRNFGIEISEVMPQWFNMVTIDGVCSGQEAVDFCFPNLSPSKKVELFKSLTKSWAKNQRLYNGALTISQKLREKYNCRVGILTNGPSTSQHTIIEHLGLRDTFDFCYASGDKELGIRKPSVELIRRLEKLENIAPQTALFLGDSMQKDIKPALDCGWNGLHVNPTNEVIANITFSDFEQHISDKQSFLVNWSRLT